MTRAGKSVALATLSLTLLSACGKKEEPKPLTTLPASPRGEQVKKPSTVIVPPFVQGKWQAVKIVFTDKITGKEADFTIPVGGTQQIPRTGISVSVENFLPHFTMEGTTLTSQSNQPKNPAVQVVVLENGQLIYKGWLFELYPTTHAFQHPKYGFRLAGYVASP